MHFSKCNLIVVAINKEEHKPREKKTLEAIKENEINRATIKFPLIQVKKFLYKIAKEEHS